MNVGSEGKQLEQDTQSNEKTAIESFQELSVEDPPIKHDVFNPEENVCFTEDTIEGELNSI
jgi:hypothetical protein